VGGGWEKGVPRHELGRAVSVSDWTAHAQTLGYQAVGRRTSRYREAACEWACVSQSANARAMDAFCPQREDVQRATSDLVTLFFCPGPCWTPPPPHARTLSLYSAPISQTRPDQTRPNQTTLGVGIPASPSPLAPATPPSTPSMSYRIRKVHPWPPRIHSHRTAHHTHARRAPSRPCQRPGSTLRCARNHQMWEPCRLSLRPVTIFAALTSSHDAQT
jgi:hypothetical protein